MITNKGNGEDKKDSLPTRKGEIEKQSALSPEAEEQIEELLDRWEAEQELGNDLSPFQLIGADFPYLAELTRKIDRLRGVKWIQKASKTQIGTFWQKGDEPIPGYRLESPLGRGGFGEVWKASSPNTITVAIKLVSWTEKLAESEWKAVQSIRDLNHPHLIGILGIWRTELTLVIAMELADTCLWKLWQENKLSGKSALPEEKIREWFLQAAMGIDTLHYAKMEHRDIKPSNLLLVNGKLKVADFGLCRLRERSFTTQSSALSIAYAPPEFFDGKTAATSDQYSLAVTWCQMRGGMLPFEGTAAKVVAGHLRKQPDLSMLPIKERPAVARALAKEPKERWDSCGQFVAHIGKAVPKPLITRRNLLLTGLAAVPVLGYAGYRIGIPKSDNKLEIINQVTLPEECRVNRMVKAGYFHPEISGRLADGLGQEHFAGVAAGNSVLIYRLKNMELVRQIVVGGTACMTFHPLEVPVFYVANNDGDVFEYHLFRKDPITTYRQNELDINDIKLSFDAAKVYCASCDTNIYKYLTKSPEVVGTFKGHRAIVFCLDIPESATKMLSGGFDGQVILWDLIEQKMIAANDIHSSVVIAIRIFEIGSQAVSISRDLKVKLIDMETGKLKLDISMLPDIPLGLAIIDNKICVSCNDGIIRIWNPDGKELLRTDPVNHKFEQISYITRSGFHYDKISNSQILVLTNEGKLLHCQLPKF